MMQDTLLNPELQAFRDRPLPSGSGRIHTLRPDTGCGIGLKPVHTAALLNTLPDLGFLEIHAENYMGDGGRFHQHLTQLREHYALSIHGVGLSIGSESPLDSAHLKRLDTLLKRYQPESFSEHLAWSTHHGHYLNDLLPLVYDRPGLQRVCDHIDQIQSFLQRRMLLENPSTYIAYASSELHETEFISEVIRRTGCGLLLDVNNVYVSCTNHRWNTHTYLARLPLQHVHEIHLAGFSDHSTPDDPLLIDSHDQPVADAVWDLYQHVICQTGPVATLIERDGNLPPLDILLAEAHTAQNLIRTLCNVQEQPCVML